MLDDIPEFRDLSHLKKAKLLPPYPFSGIVGQQAMKKALLLIAVNPKIGSLLIRGENGIGKMTAALALESLLPTIEVAAECLSNCDAGDPKHLCIDCGKRGTLEVREVKHPFMRLPVGTSRHRIFGGFEKDGTFVPGILSKVNRGYLVMDRANLQDPGLLDAIFNVHEAKRYEAAEGDNRYGHPSNFGLIATTNPLEHEFSKERLHRFSMVVTATSISDVEERIEIVRRVENFKEDPKDFLQRAAREEGLLRGVIANARELMTHSEIPRKTLDTIDRVMTDAGIEGHKVKSSLVEAAKANAAIENRYWATLEDVSEIVDLVMSHRIA